MVHRRGYYGQLKRPVQTSFAPCSMKMSAHKWDYASTFTTAQIMKVQRIKKIASVKKVFRVEKILKRV